MKPNFLIIGASRCGTTSLFHYLREHPDIFLAKGKELHFFDLNFDRGWAWYERAFASAGKAIAVGEATPAYVYDEEAINRIARYLPTVRHVAILRNPVDRAYSHYWANRARGRERLSFECAVEAEHERLRRGDKQQRLNYSYLDQGLYLEQLLRVTKRFPREQLFVCLFEDLVDDAEALFLRLGDFLGIDASIRLVARGQRVNSYMEFRSLRLRRVGRSLPTPLRNAIGRVNARAAKYPPMSPATRDELTLRFEEANEELGAWLGRDLAGWSVGRIDRSSNSPSQEISGSRLDWDATSQAGGRKG